MKNINENTKVTLTVGQLKKLVTENVDFNERVKQYKESEKKLDEEIDKFIDTLQKMATYARNIGMSHGTGASERKYVERMEKIANAVKEANSRIEEGIKAFNKFAMWNAGIDDGDGDGDEVDIEDDEDEENEEDDESYLRQREAWAASQYVGASEEDAYSDLDDVRNGY